MWHDGLSFNFANPRCKIPFRPDASHSTDKVEQTGSGFDRLNNHSFLLDISTNVRDVPISSRVLLRCKLPNNVCHMTNIEVS